MTKPCQRIVSLLPSATDWLGFLGHASRLIGISHECDLPPGVTDLPRVTRAMIQTDRSSREIDQQVRQFCDSQDSLYQLDVAGLTALQPDLIVTQSLCGVCAISQPEVVKVAADLGCQLFDLQAQTFQQVLEEGVALADVVGNSVTSQTALERLQSRVTRIKQSTGHSRPRPKVTLLEWTDPLFCSGHWTPQLIQWAGACDPIGKPGRPSRQITFVELGAADPDLLLVACCGMNLDRTRAEWERIRRVPEWSELRCVKNEQVHLFDGSAYFNRSGPRLVDALEQVAGLVHRWRPSS